MTSWTKYDVREQKMWHTSVLTTRLCSRKKTSRSRGIYNGTNGIIQGKKCNGGKKCDTQCDTYLCQRRSCAGVPRRHGPQGCTMTPRRGGKIQQQKDCNTCIDGTVWKKTHYSRHKHTLTHTLLATHTHMSTTRSKTSRPRGIHNDTKGIHNHKGFIMTRDS